MGINDNCKTLSTRKVQRVEREYGEQVKKCKSNAESKLEQNDEHKSVHDDFHGNKTNGRQEFDISRKDLSFQEDRTTMNAELRKCHHLRKITLKLLILFGLALRIIGLYNDSISEWASSLMEVNTPRTNVLEIKEASYLIDHGVPLKEQTFHQPALFILLFRFLPEFLFKLIFFVAELIIINSLGRLAKKNSVEFQKYKNKFSRYSISLETLSHLKNTPKAMKFVLESIKEFEKENIDAQHESKSNNDSRILKESNKLKNIVTLVYALNPFSIMSCVGKSLSIFTSLSIILSSCYAVEGRTTKSMLVLALSCYLSPFSCLLVLAIISMCARATGKSYWSLLKKNLPLLLFAFFSLIYSSALVSGSWSNITNVYREIFDGNYTFPNLGALWYLNIEVFPEYRLLLNRGFIVGLIIFSIPISFKFRNDPIFALTCLCMMCTVAKSEQLTSDLSLCISFLSLHYKLLYTRTSVRLLLITSITYPVFYFIYTARYFWINTDSISPNYLFFSNIYLNGIEVFVFVTLMRTYKERLWLLHNGVVKEMNIAYTLG